MSPSISRRSRGSVGVWDDVIMGILLGHCRTFYRRSRPSLVRMPIRSRIGPGVALSVRFFPYGPSRAASPANVDQRYNAISDSDTIILHCNCLPGFMGNATNWDYFVFLSGIDFV